MKVNLIRKTNLSGDTNCPSLWATDRGTYLVQGWKVVDPLALATLGLPEHEDVVEIPADLIAEIVVGMR